MTNDDWKASMGELPPASPLRLSVRIGDSWSRGTEAELLESKNSTQFLDGRDKNHLADEGNRRERLLEDKGPKIRHFIVTDFRIRDDDDDDDTPPINNENNLEEYSHRNINNSYDEYNESINLLDNSNIQSYQYHVNLLLLQHITLPSIQKLNKKSITNNNKSAAVWCVMVDDTIDGGLLEQLVELVDPVGYVINSINNQSEDEETVDNSNKLVQKTLHKWHTRQINPLTDNLITNDKSKLAALTNYLAGSNEAYMLETFLSAGDAITYEYISSIHSEVLNRPKDNNRFALQNANRPTDHKVFVSGGINLQWYAALLGNTHNNNSEQQQQGIGSSTHNDIIPQVGQWYSNSKLSSTGVTLVSPQSYFSFFGSPNTINKMDDVSGGGLQQDHLTAAGNDIVGFLYSNKNWSSFLNALAPQHNIWSLNTNKIQTVSTEADLLTELVTSQVLIESGRRRPKSFLQVFNAPTFDQKMLIQEYMTKNARFWELLLEEFDMNIDTIAVVKDFVLEHWRCIVLLDDGSGIGDDGEECSVISTS